MKKGGRVKSRKLGKVILIALSVIGGIGGAITTFDLFSKLKIWRAIIDFLGSMFKLKPPDILLLILILGILVWLFLLNKKGRRSSRKILGKPISIKDFRKLKKFPEHVFILTVLGNQDVRDLEQRYLSPAYKKEFPDKQQIDFHAAINFLKKGYYIEEFEHGATNEICYGILPRGLDLIGKVREEGK